MNTYNNFGKAAVFAAMKGENPILAWENATKQVFKTISSQEKQCPKNAFLGICEEGLVKGFRADTYLKSNKPNLNKKYALEAVRLLKKNPNLSAKELWDLVKENLQLGDKRHNSQMDVVIALFQNNFL